MTDLFIEVWDGKNSQRGPTSRGDPGADARDPATDPRRRAHPARRQRVKGSVRAGEKLGPDDQAGGR